MERIAEAGRHIGAAVAGPDGAPLGVQLKTQLDPREEGPYLAGTDRQPFEVDGPRFGLAI
jgi:predicted amidohydrolase